ncbi:MAG: glycosyltransferase [Bacteroidota bacterium]|nr:glycosyltransferase [Bacteroidota bacterium]
MGFASKYIARHIFREDLFISEPPDSNLGMILIIPCYNEPDIVLTLNSLTQCTSTSKSAEVIIVINAPENASPEIKSTNFRSHQAIKELSAISSSKLKFHCLYASDLPSKWAGAGLARKIGMDEAVRRFELLDYPDGIIISLDADCRVEPNYLVEIEKTFRNNKRVNACTIYFEHPVNGEEFPQQVYEGITLYELYMRYYRQSLLFAGFPHAIHTVGSAFAVKASAYIRQGGMNRKQAGEDFYFLQKLIPLGGITELNTTKVIPSCRLSDRVPFGTGPALKKWVEGIRELDKAYAFQAFIDLKVFFTRTSSLYRISPADFDILLTQLPLSVSSFLKAEDFYATITELGNNCSSPQIFTRRFWHLFNAFKILKFLNFTREQFYESQELVKVCHELFEAIRSSQNENYAIELSPMLSKYSGSKAQDHDYGIYSAKEFLNILREIDRTVIINI